MHLSTPLAAAAVVLALAWSASPVHGAGTLLPEVLREPCRGRLNSRVGSCALSCMLSARLCRVCCKKKQLDSDDDDAHETTTGTSRTTRRMTTKDGGDEESTGESSDRPGKPDDDDEPTLVFPDKLPDGTQDAMLETAAHILAIVSREEPERIRIWVENPQRNLDNLDQLAAKLASFPRAPFGRSYWRLVLRASKDRPFTLLREALAVRAAYQQTAVAGGRPAETTATAGEGGESETTVAGEGVSTEAAETTEATSEGAAEWWWRQWEHRDDADRWFLLF